MPINVFELAGYTPNLFKYEPLNIFGSIDTILTEKSEDDLNNPIFHAVPEIPIPWVEDYRQSAINGELLTIDDIVFNDYWKEYHSWADEWDCVCKEEDKTQWCYWDHIKISAKMQPVIDITCAPMGRFYDVAIMIALSIIMIWLRNIIEQSMLMHYYTFWRNNVWAAPPEWIQQV